MVNKLGKVLVTYSPVEEADINYHSNKNAKTSGNKSFDNEKSMPL